MGLLSPVAKNQALDPFGGRNPRSRIGVRSSLFLLLVVTVGEKGDLTLSERFVEYGASVSDCG